MFVITRVTIKLSDPFVNCLSGLDKDRKMKTQMAAHIVAVIKLARALGYKYEVIASYFVINQGRIADVMKGRIGPNVTPAKSLPPDFPALAH